jgi:hypothetical protein
MAIPAACKGKLIACGGTATNLGHHLIFDKLVGHSSQIFEGLTAFTGYAFKASTREPFRELGH